MTMDEFHLKDEEDVKILMHRDTHFGRNFDIMLSYYKKGGVGVDPDIEVDRIKDLYLLEKKGNLNLSAILLSGADAEKVAGCIKAYKKLRGLYEQRDDLPNNYPILIADLILSEEEDSEKETEAIVREKEKIVPSLLALLNSDEYYDSLFPGYGRSPRLAVKCLGKIGDKKSIVCLFEAYGRDDFNFDNAVIDALKALGEPSIGFLLTVVQGKPYNLDNEKAADMLVHFQDDPKVANACLEILLEPQVRSNTIFAAYLILACSALQEEKSRKSFKALLEDPVIDEMLKQDIKMIAKDW